MTKELTGNEIKSNINDEFHELIISIENDHLVIKNDNEKYCYLVRVTVAYSRFRKMIFFQQI